MHSDSRYVRALFEVGAVGYIVKVSTELIPAIRIGDAGPDLREP